MSRTPVETERLILRPYEESDRETMVRFYMDPAVMSGRKYGVRDEGDANTAFEVLLSHWHEHGFGLWAPVEKATGVVMGELGLRYTDDPDQVEVSYGLFEPHRGQGYATEGALAALGYGFSALGLEQIVAKSRGSNAVSHKVLEKIGMRFVEKRETEKHSHGVVSYVITRPEWVKG
ncbi:MAG: GNAT family N-acetyltransferase [Rhodospirillaceae bacterium]|nr:GNAT family N-acetyltransferase [Rhodospirillaceae bacterium]MBT6138784.1 GNAT family N-acetyltransferase [Rhodospirillaceae bacterium]